jgi:hypothetical protein
MGKDSPDAIGACCLVHESLDSVLSPLSRVCQELQDRGGSMEFSEIREGFRKILLGAGGSRL